MVDRVAKMLTTQLPNPDFFQFEWLECNCLLAQSNGIYKHLARYLMDILIFSQKYVMYRIKSSVLVKGIYKNMFTRHIINI